MTETKKIKFSEGYPTVFVGSHAIINFADPEVIPFFTSGTVVEESKVGNYAFMPWFSSNDFPAKAITLIDANPVLKRALIIHTKTTLGQGIYPAKLIGFDGNGNEILEAVTDIEVVKLLNVYMTRRYLSKCAYDLYSMGNAFVKLIPNLNGSEIVEIIPVNARHIRLSVPDKATGQVLSAYETSDWSDAKPKDILKYILLDEESPLQHLELIKSEGRLTAPILMHLRSDFTSNDFYAIPEWYSAKKWIDISSKIADLIDAGMNNMLNIYIHLKIPYSYWDKKYPLDEFDGKLKLRQEKIARDLQKLDESLTSTENAKKTLISMFGDSDNGEDKWELDVLDKKFSQEDFVKSTAADTQIAIASGVMPDLLGLMYGNSKGGSMQRELLLIQYALSWTDRQKLADPLELMIRFNLGDAHSDLQIRFRNTFLTPLSEGSETKTEIS